MNTTLRRTAAAAAATVLLGAVGALTTIDAATAAEPLVYLPGVSVSAGNGGVMVLLDADATNSVAASPGAAQVACTQAVTTLGDYGYTFSTWTIDNCQQAVYTCAADAYFVNRTGGVYFSTASDSYGCLTRD